MCAYMIVSRDICRDGWMVGWIDVIFPLFFFANLIIQ